MPIENSNDLLCPKCGVRWGEHLVPPVQKPTCPGPPRPADMAELARMVAKELRGRGIWADSVAHIFAVRVPQRMAAPKNPHDDTVDKFWSMLSGQFDNLTPRECADVIQAEEAKRAAEWAGDI